jgi:hypothetical protein
MIPSRQCFGAVVGVVVGGGAGAVVVVCGGAVVALVVCGAVVGVAAVVPGT